VHEANAEAAIEIGGVIIPVTGARWKSRPGSAGAGSTRLIIQGDADELAYLTQRKAQDATVRAQDDLHSAQTIHDRATRVMQAVADGEDLLPPRKS
jgi:hypothetical protein